MMSNVELRNLADLVAIRTVLDEYCLRLEIDSFDEWLDLFTPDTEYEVFRRTLRGRDELSAMLSQAPHGLHLGGAARIELDGNTAQTVQNYAFLGDDEATSNAGWYYRTLVRTNAGWRISRTRVKIQKRNPVGRKLPPE
jgi:hypothetical protein